MKPRSAGQLHVGPFICNSMNWMPNRYVAAALSFLAPPLGMLYVSRLPLAVLYLLASVLLGLAQFWLVAKNYPVPVSLLLVVLATVHSFRIAARAAQTNERPWFTRWQGLVGLSLGAVGILAAFRAFFYEPFHLPSGAMLPSMPVHSYVVVQKFGYGNYEGLGIPFAHTELTAPLAHGDVLVFEYPRDRSIRYIKRLIGLPGDRIEYKGKKLYVNGKALPTASIQSTSDFEMLRESDYQIQTTCGAPAEDFDVTVNNGHMFLLGDNRDNSHDSRHWGQVPYDHVIGKVVLLLKDDKAQRLRLDRAKPRSEPFVGRARS